MTDTYDEASNLWPGLARYKKVIVSFLGTTVPFVIFLAEQPRSFAQIVAASGGYVLTNFGVYRVTNE